MRSYFENKLTYNGIVFQLTDKSTPDEREIHPYHEILFFLEGEAELLTEHRRHALANRSLLIIPKQTYHFIRLYSADFLRLKISIPENSESALPVQDLMQRFRIVEQLPEGAAFALNRAVRILREKEGKKAAFHAYAALLMLIAELDSREAEGYADALPPMGTVSRIVRYISEHLAEDLTVEALARAMNVSASGVIHGFKKELGISLHSYITQRRLILAREQILSGQKPSKIYPDFGYAEYSSFYRAYVKFFGHSPSDEKSGAV